MALLCWRGHRNCFIIWLILCCLYRRWRQLTGMELLSSDSEGVPRASTFGCPTSVGAVYGCSLRADHKPPSPLFISTQMS